MRPVEMLFGPTGATKVLPAGDHHCDVVCRNSMTKKDTILTVDYDTGKKVEKWINEGKPGCIQDVFPELSADQREQMLSGITPEEWNEMFGGDENE